MKVQWFPILFSLTILIHSSALSQTIGPGAASEGMRILVEQLSAMEAPHALGEQLLSWDMVKSFYVNRRHQQVWMQGGKATPQAMLLVAEVAASANEGLRPRTYHYEALKTLFPEGGLPAELPLSPEQSVAAELILTDSYFLLADHYLGGRIDPVRIEPDWEATAREVDAADLLNRSWENGTAVESLRSLLPQQPEYARIREAYAKYRMLSRAGGWPLIDAGPTLKPGMRDSRVLQLRARLAVTDSMVAATGVSADLFDTDLVGAVERFQSRHGLTRDGLVGSTTLRELNVSCEHRAAQLLTSLERWRWLPEAMGARYIYVNIANFELDLVEAGSQVWTTRVIVGKHYRKTPVFSSQLSYMVVNPTWTVPQTILKNDVIPAVRKNIGYLAEKKMTVYRSTLNGQQPVDPTTVDWSKNSIPFNIVQSPGPHNALGAIKFMFPNKFNVYIHDTPSRELFNKEVRTFSSGCIRIEQPVRFAEILLEIDNPNSLPVLLEALKSSETKTIRLTANIPVHLLYLTSWVDPNGVVHFRDDIYGRDERLLAALSAFAPLDSEEN